MKQAKLLLLTVVATAFAACCPCMRANKHANATLTEGSWQMVQLDAVAFKASGDSFTLTFTTEGRVQGKGDCNRVSGTCSFNNENGELSLGGLVSTRAFCANQKTEDRFVTLLGQLTSYSIDGDMLMLFVDGELKIMMERMK